MLLRDEWKEVASTEVPNEVKVLMHHYSQGLADSTIRPIGVYVVGSTALGAFEEHQSDVDFITLLDDDYDHLDWFDDLGRVHETLNVKSPLGRRLDGT